MFLLSKETVSDKIFTFSNEGAEKMGPATGICGRYISKQFRRKHKAPFKEMFLTFTARHKNRMIPRAY